MTDNKRHKAQSLPRFGEWCENVRTRCMLIADNDLDYTQIGYGSYTLKLKGRRICLKTMEPMSRAEWELRFNEGYGFDVFFEWLKEHGHET